MNALGLDAIYVLNVRAYEDRRRHVMAELQRFGLAAEFIHDFDVADLTPATDREWFAAGAPLNPGQRSCAMKHLEALRRIRDRGQRAALVLEDDVVLSSDFDRGVREALDEARRWPDRQVIFIGSGGNFYTPRSERRPGQRLYPSQRGRFGDSYILGAGTAGARLEWLARQRISKPIDNQFEQVDQALGVTMLWLEDPVVEQGSKNGLFHTTLEAAPPPIQRLKFGWEKLRRKYLYQLWR